MDIRLISLDLDGTALLPDQASFSQRTEDALLAAHRQGVAIVPTTGRQFAMLPPPLRVKQSWANLAVLCNGAEIRRLESGEVLASRYMTAETLRPLIDRAAALGLMVELSAGGTLYLTAEDWARERTIDRLTFHLGVLDRRGHVVEGPLSAFAAGSGLVFEKMNLMGLTPALWQELAPTAQALPLSCVWSSPRSMEVTDREATKARGLERVCRLLGVDMGQVMAIGDSGNDISSLRAAGLGVAMGNAPEEVLAAADAVTGTNLQDGAAQAIERYVLRR